MLLNLATVRETLWAYGNQTVPYVSASASQKTVVDGRINQVVERFLQEMKPRNTLRRVNVPIINGMITLPRNLETALGVKLVTENNCACSPLLIYSRFHEFAHPGAPWLLPIPRSMASFRTGSGLPRPNSNVLSTV